MEELLDVAILIKITQGAKGKVPRDKFVFLLIKM
jgi:hypothetical protein